MEKHLYRRGEKQTDIYGSRSGKWSPCDPDPLWKKVAVLLSITEYERFFPEKKGFCKACKALRQRIEDENIAISD